MPGIFRHFTKCLITQFACNIYRKKTLCDNMNTLFYDCERLGEYNQCSKYTNKAVEVRKNNTKPV